MPSVAANALAFLLFCAGSLLGMSAVMRFVRNGYDQRRMQRVQLAVLLGSLVAAVVLAQLAGVHERSIEFVIVGAAVLVSAGAFLSVALMWGQAHGDPTPPRSPRRTSWWQRPAFLRLFLGLILVMAVWSAAKQDWSDVALLLAGAAGFAGLLFVNHWIGRQAAPDAGAVLLLRAMPPGPKGQDRVVAARIAPPIRYLSPVHPQRLLDPSAPEHDWQTPVATLVRRDEPVLMLPDDTAAARWVLELIRREQLQQRLFVLVPRRPDPVSRALIAASGAQLAPWPRFAAVLGEAGFVAPATPPAPGSLLTFDEFGAPVTVATGLRSLNPAAVAVLRHAAVGRSAVPESEPNG
jgi:hypothetical protein